MITRRTANALHATIDHRLDDLAQSPLYRRAGVALGSGAEPDFPAIQRSLRHGVLGAIDPKTNIGFRVGVGDPDHRRRLINDIESATGWTNRPGDWDVNVTNGSGHWVAEVGFLHASRRFGPLRRRSWSTNPVLASILVRIVKLTDSLAVHDPFCGTGTLLIMATRAARELRLSGTDHNPATLALAHANLDDRMINADLTAGDAIPFRHQDQSLDRILSNLPFGKQVGSHETNRALYPALAAEVARTLTPSGRAVLLTEDKRLLVDAVARTTGIKIIRERTLRYGGATPTAYTIVRTRRQSRPRLSPRTTR